MALAGETAYVLRFVSMSGSDGPPGDAPASSGLLALAFALAAPVRGAGAVEVALGRVTEANHPCGDMALVRDVAPATPCVAEPDYLGEVTTGARSVDVLHTT